MASTSICETVAALDVQVNGQIIGGMTWADSRREYSDFEFRFRANETYL